MRITKVFNNNTVATITSDSQEAIILGAGVGYQKKVGDVIQNEKIEKIYYIQDNLQTKFLQLLQKNAKEYLEIAEEVTNKATSELGRKLGTQILISLSDHISFAVEREREGIRLPNLMSSEIKLLYPGEYSIGLWSLDLIEKVTGVKLFSDEAAYIALHIVNASMDETPERTINILRFIKGISDIIKEEYQIDFKEDDLDYLRLTTHLKFMAQRIFKHETYKMDDVDEMYEVLIRKKKNMYCINRINDYIKTNFDYELSKPEVVYLLVHLSKII